MDTSGVYSQIELNLLSEEVCILEKEWFILEFEEKVYLHNKSLLHSEFVDNSPGAHDHCELCWARFSTRPEDLQFGYFEKDSNSWICPDCYNNFKNLFGWNAT